MADYPYDDEQQRDPLLIQERPRPSGDLIQQDNLQQAPDEAPTPTTQVDAFARGAPAAAPQEAAAVPSEAPAPDPYTPATIPLPTLYHRALSDPVAEQHLQQSEQARAEQAQADQQKQEDKRVANTVKGLKDSGVDMVTGLDGVTRPKVDDQGRVIYKPAVLSPFEDRGVDAGDNRYVSVHRDRFGNEQDVPLKPKIDPATGERYVTAADGVSKFSLGVDEDYVLRRDVTNLGKIAGTARAELTAIGSQRKELNDQISEYGNRAAVIASKKNPTDDDRAEIKRLQTARAQAVSQLDTLNETHDAKSQDYQEANAAWLEKRKLLTDKIKDQLPNSTPPSDVPPGLGSSSPQEVRKAAAAGVIPPAAAPAAVAAAHDAADANQKANAVQATNPTLADQFRAVGQGIVSGLTKGLGEIVKTGAGDAPLPWGKFNPLNWGSMLLSEGERKVFGASLGDEFKAAGGKITDAGQKLIDDKLKNTVGGKIGSFAGGVAPYVALAYATKGQSIATPVMAGLFFSTTHQSVYDDAKAHGASEPVAETTATAAGTVNALLSMPLKGVGKAFEAVFGDTSAKAVQRSIEDAMEKGGLPAVHELLQTLKSQISGAEKPIVGGVVVQNVREQAMAAMDKISEQLTMTPAQRALSVARTTAAHAAIGGGVQTAENLLKKSYNPDQGVFEGVPESAIGFGVLSAVSGGFAEVANARNAKKALDAIYRESDANARGRAKRAAGGLGQGGDQPAPAPATDPAVDEIRTAVETHHEDLRREREILQSEVDDTSQPIEGKSDKIARIKSIDDEIGAPPTQPAAEQPNEKAVSPTEVGANEPQPPAPGTSGQPANRPVPDQSQAQPAIPSGSQSQAPNVRPGQAPAAGDAPGSQPGDEGQHQSQLLKPPETLAPIAAANGATFNGTQSGLHHFTDTGNKGKETSFVVRENATPEDFRTKLAEVRNRMGGGPPVEQVATVDAAAHEAATSPHNDKPTPSLAQHEADNAELGHDSISGMPISFENPVGSIRTNADMKQVEALAKDQKQDQGTRVAATKAFAHYAAGDAAGLTHYLREIRGRGTTLTKNGAQPWANKMVAHYGRFKGVTGADGDLLDAFVKKGTPRDYSGPVFVVNQYKPNGDFDEHKVVVGAANVTEALALYKAHYPKDWQMGRNIVRMTMPQFKVWARDSRGAFDKSKPVKQGNFSHADTEQKTATVPVQEPSQTGPAEGQVGESVPKPAGGEAGRLRDETAAVARAKQLVNEGLLKPIDGLPPAKATLDALGAEIKDASQDPSSHRGKYSLRAGFVETQSGEPKFIVFIDYARLAEKNQGVADWHAREQIQKALQEEIFHIAQMEAVRRKWIETKAGTGWDYLTQLEAEYQQVEEAMDQTEREAVRAAYGEHGSQGELAGSTLGAEFVRQLLQQKHTGRITEATMRAQPIIERILAILKKVWENIKNRSAVLRDVIERTEAVLDEINAAANVPEKKPVTPQVPALPGMTPLGAKSKLPFEKPQTVAEAEANIKAAQSEPTNTVTPPAPASDKPISSGASEDLKNQAKKAFEGLFAPEPIKPKEMAIALKIQRGAEPKEVAKAYAMPLAMVERIYDKVIGAASLAPQEHGISLGAPEPSQIAERIIRPAVKTNDGKIFVGYIHADASKTAAEAGYPFVHPSAPAEKRQIADGFVTNKGNFYTRDEAHEKFGIKNTDVSGLDDEIPLSEAEEKGPWNVGLYAPEPIKQEPLPKDRRAAFMDLADKMEAEGITTPDKVAAFVNEISSGRGMKYVRELWKLMESTGAVSEDDAPASWDSVISLATTGGGPNVPTHERVSPPAGSPATGDVANAGGENQQGDVTDSGRVGGPESETPAGTGGERNAPAAGARGGKTGSGSPAKGGGDRGQDATTGAVGTGADVRGSEPDAPVEPSNYVITPADDIGGGSITQKFDGNIAAIKLLLQIEKDRMYGAATPEEKKVLVKYVGWGGMKNAFNPDKSDWKARHDELKELLTPEEFAAARSSIQDAHYTSDPVIDGIYQALQQFGFSGGKMVEGGVGLGHFIGKLPAGMRDATSYIGVEKDSITARIAQYLYPNAKIIHGGFEQANLSRDDFDASAGNPPFGNKQLFDPNFKEESKFSIHNFFIAKQIALIRPGGVGAYVVSHYFLDAMDPAARKWIDDRADFLGAIRLPNTAFKKNANTEVTTDMVFFQKREPGTKSADSSWLEAPKTSIGGQPGNLNQYFQDHPQMMLGEPSMQGTMHPGQFEFTLDPKGDAPLGEQISQAVSKLPKDIYQQAPAGYTKDLTRPPAADVPDVKVGSFFVDKNGEIRIRTKDVNTDRQSRAAQFQNKKQVERVTGMVGVRDALNDLVKSEVSDADPKAMKVLRTKLNKTYDAFVAEHGPLNAMVNRAAFRPDTDSYRVLALERNFDPGIGKEAAKKRGVPARKPTADKAPIFTERMNRGFSEVTSAQNPQDALTISLNQRGKVDLPYMSKLSGMKQSEIIDGLGDQIYQDPAGDWQQAEQYLSGNVRDKLRVAQAAAKRDSNFERNVEALEKVIPKDIAPEAITVTLGAHWVDPQIYGDFAEHMVGERPTMMAYAPAVAKWHVDLPDSSRKSTDEYGTGRAPFGSILSDLMNTKPVQVFDAVTGGGRVLNTVATAAAQQKADLIREKWNDWVMQDAGRRGTLVKKYNETMNNFADTKANGLHMTMPGKSPLIELYPHQLNSAWRIITDRTALLDQVVGSGKTFVISTAVMEMKRLGMARKQLICVPNHLTLQWRDALVQLYPNANVLYATKTDFQKKNRQAMFAKMMTGEYDATIIGHSSLIKIGLPKDAEVELLNEMLNELVDTIRQMREAEGAKRDSRFITGMERTKDALEAKLQRAMDRTGKKDQGVTFDELGIDGFHLDEAHEFKNLFYNTGMQRVAGMGNPIGSAKAFDLYVKTRWLQKRYGGKAPLVFATGTPISNSLVELFTMQRYLQGDKLKAMGLNTLDSWARVFGDVRSVYEVDPSGTRYRTATRFANFNNVGELASMYRSVADVVTTADLKQQAIDKGKVFPVPRVTGDKPNDMVAERSADQAQYFGEEVPVLDANGDELLDHEGNPIVRYEPPGSILHRIDTLDPAHPEIDNMLKITNDARKSSLDMRLINPNLPDFPGSKVNIAIKAIKARYDKWTAKKGTQLVFCDLSVPSSARGNATKKARQLAAETYVRKVGGDYQIVPDAKPVTLKAAPDMQFFVSRAIGGGYAVTEQTTGQRVGRGPTIKEAQDNAEQSDVLHPGNRELLQKDLEEKAIPLDQITKLRDEYEIAHGFKEPDDSGADESGDTTDEQEEGVSMDDVLADSSKHSVYDDMRDKLIAAGVPAHEIAFIHDYDKPEAKQKLFDSMNEGKVRILFGSTSKLGAGTNVQRRIVGITHMDAPWRPSDIEQRNGRGIRQGNLFYEEGMKNYADPKEYNTDPDAFTLDIDRLATKQSYDTRMWQLIEHKATGIEAFRKADRNTRTLEDVSGEAANAADMKAAASGNPAIQREIELRGVVSKLNLLRRAWESNRYQAERQVSWYREAPERGAANSAPWRKVRDYAAANPKPKEFTAEIRDKDGNFVTTTERKELMDAFVEAIKGHGGKRNSVGTIFGTYRGMTLRVTTGHSSASVEMSSAKAKIKGFDATTFWKGDDDITPTGLVTRMDNALDSKPSESIDSTDREIEQAARLLPAAEELAARPFDKQAELDAARDAHSTAVADLRANRRRPVSAPTADVVAPDSIASTDLVESKPFMLMPEWMRSVPKSIGGRESKLGRLQKVREQLERRSDEYETGDREVSQPPRFGETTDLLRSVNAEIARIEAEKLAENKRGEFKGLHAPEPTPGVPSADPTQGVLKSAFAELPEKERKVLAMKLANKSDAEISKATGLPPVGVATAYQIALSKMNRARQAAADVKGTMRKVTAEKPGQRTMGRPDLANPAAGELSRKLVDTVDEIRKQSGVPGKRKDKEVIAAARTRLQKNYALERRNVIEKATRGESLDDEETVIAKKIVAREALGAVRVGSDEKVLEAAKLIDAYRMTGTSAARSFRQRFDNYLSPEERASEYLAEALLTPDQGRRDRLSRLAEQITDLEEQLEEAKKQGKADAQVKALEGEREQRLAERERIIRNWTSKMAGIKKKLAALGIDLENMTEQEIAGVLKDEIKARAAIKTVQIAKADNWDALYEYWVNGLLSAPPTIAVKMMSDVAHALLDFGPQRWIEAAVNMMTPGDKSTSPNFGELPYVYKAIFPALSTAFSNVLKSWRTESPVFEGEFSGSEFNRPKAIEGAKGQIIRLPTRNIMAADDAASSALATMQVQAEAYRIAGVKEGLTGDALANRMIELTTLNSGDPNDAWVAARDHSAVLRFQNELGAFGKWIQKGKADVAGIRYIIPFPLTMSNIFKTATRKTPLGTPRLFYKLAREGMVRMDWDGSDYQYTRKEFVRDAAEQILAWALVFSLLGLTRKRDEDDGLPVMTGSSPYTPGNKGLRDLAMRTAPPTSIRIGGHWYNYSRIEPWGVMLVTMVDMINDSREVKEGGDVSGAIGKLLNQALTQVKDKTFARGVGDMLNALQDGEHATEWAGNFATTWLPFSSLVKAAARNSDETIREQKVWGREGWTQSLLDSLKYRALPIASDVLQPKIDLWGREIKRDQGISPATDWLYRMTVPVQTVKADKALDIDRMILNWNNAHPEEIFAPAPPPPVWQKKIDGKEQHVYMSREEYRRFLEVSGKSALGRIEIEGLNYENPGRKDIEAVTKALEKARSSTRESLWQEHLASLAR